MSGSTEATMTRLQDFVHHSGNALAKIAGGAAVLAVLATATTYPAAARSHHVSHTTHAYHSSGSSHSWFSPKSWWFWHSTRSSSTSDETIEQAKKALENETPVETLRHNIDARRILIEDALRSLESLKSAVDDTDGLNDNERIEAIRAAADRYNVDVNMLDINVKAVVGEMPGTGLAPPKAY
jgi:hypothetical protein